MGQEGAGDPIAELGGKVDGLNQRVDVLDGRVDELGRRMDNGFNRIDAKFEKQSERMADEFTAVRKEMSEGFQRMQRLMIEGGGIVVTLLVASRLFG
jgi:hypothetical protein